MSYIMPIMPKISKLKLPALNLGESLGRRLARLRKERGYTQHQLADEIGITQKLISDYELEKIRPYPEMIARFALTLRVSTDILIGIQDNDNSESEPNLKIMQRMRKIEELPPAKQKVLLQNIDMFLKGVESENK